MSIVYILLFRYNYLMRLCFEKNRLEHLKAKFANRMIQEKRLAFKPNKNYLITNIMAFVTI